MGVKIFGWLRVCTKHSAGTERLIIALLTGAWLVGPANAQMPPPTLTPEKIGMGAFYSGSSVRIQGSAPDASGVLVVIRGVEKDEFLNRKGRVGIIWLNADRIHFKQAPLAFLRFSSADVDSLLDRANLDQYTLDEAAIRNRVHCLVHCKCKLTGGQMQQSCTHGVEPDSAYGQLLRDSFLNLKMSEGSYQLHSGAVKLASFSGPGTQYDLSLQWPRKLPPGSYSVEVYACRDRKVIAHSAATLELVEVGFPAYMANLAAKRPWTYGSGAVLIAMIAGFGIDALAVRLRRIKRRARAGEAAPSLAKAETAPTGAKPEETHDHEIVHRG